ncbi:MAG: alpha/beta fold hydrolase [Bryobacteraceae bacterium]|nr:alpha/beta fold hydrolase [Bryobacteraceae bacterium]
MSFFAALLASLLFQQPAAAPVLDGVWEGPISGFAGKVTIRLHMKQSPDGKLEIKMDVPEQGAAGIPVPVTSFAEGVLKWEIPTIQAKYEGKLKEGGKEIEGTFMQITPQPLTLKKLDKPPAGPNRPQEPKPPFPYLTEEVTFPSAAGGVTLAGTLTLPPAGAKKHPAVVLISGSGPQDRDEQLMGHKPFWILADHLSRRGFAVLRYDDRGFGKSTGRFSTATSTDFSRDAEGALNYLKARPEVDPKRVGFIGHSEGGLIAPMIAARRPDVAFIVLIAGTGVPGKEVVAEQARRILKASGMADSAVETNAAVQQKIFEILKQEPDEAAARKLILEAMAGQPNAEATARSSASAWFREFAFYDPAPALEKVKCPVLAVNGELDLQVLPDQNLPPIEAALKKGGNKDFQLVRLPKLNHLLQTAKTGLPAEYGQIEETMAPAALETIANWLAKRAGMGAQQ